MGGYYDAGDNVKFNFPMAFSTTMLSWSVIEFGKFMGPDQQHALEAIQWATDYFLKATSIPGFVFAQVGIRFVTAEICTSALAIHSPQTLINGRQRRGPVMYPLWIFLPISHHVRHVQWVTS